MRSAAWTRLSELIQPVSQSIRDGATIPVRLMFGCLAGAKRLDERPGANAVLPLGPAKVVKCISPTEGSRQCFRSRCISLSV